MMMDDDNEKKKANENEEKQLVYKNRLLDLNTWTPYLWYVNVLAIICHSNFYQLIRGCNTKLQ